MSGRAHRPTLSVSQLFPHDTHLLDAVYKTHFNVKAHHSVLNFSACSDVDQILAPAPVDLECDRHHPHFNALCKSLPVSSSSCQQILYLHDVHVIGILKTSQRGFLRIETPPSTYPLPILIASSPPPQLRHAPVYISNWRVIPPDKYHAEPILEVLLKDIHPLFVYSPPSPIQSMRGIRRFNLSQRISLPTRKIFAVCGTVTARSHVIAPHSNIPAFLLELSGSTVAVTLAFRGSLVSWWPFLPVGAAISVSGVRQANATSIPSKRILAVVSNAVVRPATEADLQVTSQPLPSSATSLPDQAQKGQQQQQQLPSKNLKSDLNSYPNSNTPSPIETRHAAPIKPDTRNVVSREPQNTIAPPVVDFEGIVSQHIPPATILFDKSVALHLADFDICLAGRFPNRAFRPGTRIRASHLIAITRPGTSPRLFATARTIVDILSFAKDAPCIEPPSLSELWIRLCKRLSQDRIIAAEELFDAFVRKFRHWFATTPIYMSFSSQSQSQAPVSSLSSPSAQKPQQQNAKLKRWDRSVENALLGDIKRPGLVQFVMRLLGDDEDVLRAHSHPVRNVAREFVAPNLYASKLYNGPCVPELSRVRETLSFLSRDSMARQHCVALHQSGVSSTASRQNFITVFNDEHVVRKLIASARGPGRMQTSSMGIALIGLLKGISDGRGLLCLADGTDELDLRCTPSLPPNLLGAMVCIRNFTAVVNSRHTGDRSSNSSEDMSSSTMSVDITILCDENDFLVVVDGPCVDMKDQEADERVEKLINTLSQNDEINDINVAARTASQRTLRVLTQGSASMNQGCDPKSSIPCTEVDDDDVGVVDVPLVCIFVERVIRNRKSCTLVGRLLATILRRSDEAWTVVDCDQKGFWTCELHLRGESVLTTTCCFTEGRLYAISCTDLEGIEDPLSEFSKRAWRAHKRGHARVKLTCELESMLPWVENLGLGTYMRFVGRGMSGNAQNEGHLRQFQDSCMSEEGEQYIYISKAVEQFRKEQARNIVKKIWNVYRWKNDCPKKSNTVGGDVDDDDDDDENIGYRWASKKMSVCGIVKSVETVIEGDQTGSTQSKCVVNKVTIVDEETGLFGVTISFYDGFAHIRGMAKGMKVIVRNFIRVPMESRREGFDFVANNETSVCIQSRSYEHVHMIDKDMQDEGCACEYMPSKSFSDVSRELDMMFIEEFMGHGDAVAGLIRIREVRVEYLRLRLGSQQTSCSECGMKANWVESSDTPNVTDTKRWGNYGQGKSNNNKSTKKETMTDTQAILMEMVVQVDDGSRVGVLRCSGYGKCIRLVNATRTEQDALRRLATLNIEVELADGAESLFRRFYDMAKTDAQTIWGLFQTSRAVSNIVAVLNRAAVNERRNGHFGALVSKQYRLGFKRSLLVCSPPQTDRVLLDCVTLFQESIPSKRSATWENQYDMDDNDEIEEVRNEVSCLDILKTLVET